MEIEEYKKYRWFFTRSGKLVLGGKSAEQNDSFISKLKESSKDFFVLHTHSPGSPFSVIISDISKVSSSDLKQTAIFTASFSQQWKKKSKSASVDVFKLSSMEKSKGLKTGTWQVRKKQKSLLVPLELSLTTQKNILRSVPEETALKSKTLLKISPGNMEKSKAIKKIYSILNKKFPETEISSALPSGPFRIIEK
jgi:hypothetical protein